MSRPILEEFLNNRNHLGIKLSSASVGGLLKKRLVIPASTAALAVFPDGAVSLFREGQEVSGKFELTIAKTADFRLRLGMADLRSQDGISVSASVTIAVRIQTKQPDLFRDVVRSIFTFPGTFPTAALKSFCAPEIKKQMSAVVAGEKAGDLHKRDRFHDASTQLGPVLERYFFGTGVRFLKVLDVSFVSPEYEKAVADEARRAALEQERGEREKRKKDHLKRLSEAFEDQEIRDVLAKIPDERMRGVFYAKLMEDDSVKLTAQDVVQHLAGCGEEVVEGVYRAMEGLLTGAPAVETASLVSERAERLYAAVGRKVVEIDAHSPRENARELSFDQPLRSVRVASTEKEDFLLAGSKRCVYVVNLAGNPVIREFPLPQGKDPRGGVNSMDLSGDVLVASHSEFGVVRWDATKAGEAGEILFGERTEANRTTRGAQIRADRIYFASGPYVYGAPLGNSGEPERYITDSESSITGIILTGERIFAGTENGTILLWKTDEPENPRVLLRRRDAILTLRVARICSIPHLVYSARDLSVRARVIGQNMETAYESGGATIGVVDASSDLVCATDGNGRRIYFWKATAPTRPEAEVDTAVFSEKPVLDIWMKKVPIKS